MSAQDLLDFDLSDIGRQLGAGLRWWLAELSQMLPDRWRIALAGRPSLCAERAAEGGYRFSRGGRAIAAPPRTSRRTPVVLLLPQKLALVHRTETPLLADADVRRLLTLNLERTTPFLAEDVYAAVACGGPGQAGRRPASMAVVLRRAALEALEHARASGLEPQVLGVAGVEGFEQALDFLPQMGPATGASARSRLYVGGLIVLLLLANLAAAILRDEADLARLRGQALAERPGLQAALKLRRQVTGEDARRARLITAHLQGEPLAAIDAATGALPDGAWVQRLAWNGRALRLAGYKQEGIDVLAALRGSPAFSNVRDTTADTPARLAAGEPFDVTADALEHRPR